MYKGDKSQLKPLFSKHLKNKRIIGFDIETHGKNNTFYMGGLYLPDGTYKSFYDKQKLLNEFKKKKYYGSTYVVATNLAFDLVGTFFNTKEWNSNDIIMSGGRMISATLHAKNRQKLTFIDSFNHAPLSVEQMGEILKLPKLKQPKALGKIPQTNLEELELEVYNKRDCEVTQNFTELLMNGYYDAGGKIKLTIASTSLDIYRRKYLRYPINKEEKLLGWCPNDMIFKSYYGGRTENFKRGYIKSTSFDYETNTFKKEGIHYRLYDINSLYASCMINKYPDPNHARYKHEGNIKLINTYEGVSKVKMFCPKMRYPFLAVRLNGKLTFPTGVIEGYYTHVEIRKAITLGYRLDTIEETLYYKKTFYPFKEFVLDMYKKRNELKAKNDPREIVYKLVMNSLYGKFASKHLTETIFFNKENLDNEGLEAVKNNPATIMKDDNNGMIINKKICNEAYVLPILSSYTTAYARIKLYDYLVNYNGIYCDTDSIVTSRIIPESDELGKMKVDYDIIEGILVKPKMYMFKILKKGKVEEIIKLKGIPKKVIFNNEEIKINKEVFLSILDGQEVKYKKFTKLKEGIRRGLMPNSIMDMKKYIQLTDNKRIWLDDFNYKSLGDSLPLHIPEITISLNELEVNQKCNLTLV